MSAVVNCPGRAGATQEANARHLDDSDDGPAFMLAGFDVLGSISEEEARGLGRVGGEELLAERPHATAPQLRRAEAFLRAFAEVLEEQRRPMLRR